MSARSAKRAGAGWCARTGLAGAAPNSTCHSLNKFIWKSQEPTAPELQSNSELPKRSGAVKRPPSCGELDGNKCRVRSEGLHAVNWSRRSSMCFWTAEFYLCVFKSFGSH